MSQSQLQPFGENLWFAEAAGVHVGGFHYPSRMTVLRGSDGTLTLFSPIEMSDPLKEEVLSLGTPACLVAPNHLHHLWLGAWQQAFPAAKLLAAPGLAKKRPDLRIDEELLGTAPLEWKGEIDLAIFRGSLITTEAVFFHQESRTAIFTDLLQNFSEDWVSGWRKTIAQLDRLISEEPQVPQKFRVSFLHRKQARAALRYVRSWPVEKILMAHGSPVEAGGAEVIERAFSWLETGRS